MKIKYFIAATFIFFLAQAVQSQNNVDKKKVKANKIKLKPAAIEQDSALATFPVLVSVVEENGLKNPRVQESFGQYAVNFYPEPGKGIVYVQFENLDKKIKPELSLYDSEGDEIYKIKAKTRLNVINLRKIPPGTYLVTTNVNEKISTWEIIKE